MVSSESGRLGRTLAMDVRCDRCQTEYELDDEAVAGAGASVQCTTCGHTFVVSRMPPIELRTTPSAGVPGAPPGAAPEVAAPATGSAPPPMPEWVLSTEAGQSHRLRDLTTLQKWIVERRVSRVDRVAHRGGPWRPLGEVDELRAFFDVVEQADRQTTSARAAEAYRGARSTMPATPRGVQSAGGRGPSSPDLDDGDVRAVGREGRRPRFDDRFPDTIPPDEDLSLLVGRPRRTGLKVVGGLLFVGLAAGVWYLGFRDPHGFKLASGTSVPAPASSPVVVPDVPSPPAAVAVPAPGGVPAASAPAPTTPAAAPPAPGGGESTSRHAASWRIEGLSTIANWSSKTNGDENVLAKAASAASTRLSPTRRTRHGSWRDAGAATSEPEALVLFPVMLSECEASLFSLM
jgi:predicted Zn finger-like uncharacterized protein